MMCTDYTYNLLKKDFEANKQIVLFVGAGINYSIGHQILWNDVMEYLFKNVLSSITSANVLCETSYSFCSVLGTKG